MNRKTIIEKPPDNRYNDDPFRDDPRFAREIPGVDDELGYEPTDNEMEDWLELQAHNSEDIRQAFKQIAAEEQRPEYPKHPGQISF